MISLNINYYSMAGMGGAVTRRVFLNFIASKSSPSGSKIQGLPQVSLQSFSSARYPVKMKGKTFFSHRLHLPDFHCYHDSVVREFTNSSLQVTMTGLRFLDITTIYNATFNKQTSERGTSFHLDFWKVLISFEKPLLLSWMQISLPPPKQYHFYTTGFGHCPATIGGPTEALCITVWVSLSRYNTGISRHFCETYWRLSCWSFK